MNFPKELTDLKQWTVWRKVTRNGKDTKIPVDPLTGELAKSNDPSTWRGFDEAFLAFRDNENIHGLGFFFTPPYIGIDLDDIGDDLDDFFNGNYDNKVYEFYESFRSYAEVSPSGKGLHIISKGKIPGDRRRKGDVEIYQEGRFFTMTGNSLGKYTSINEANKDNFKKIYDKYLSDKVIELKGNASFNRQHGIKHNLSDDDVIHKILSSKQADDFKNFMNNSWQEKYTSQSEADLAFANLLAFWCARDYSQMDSIFRQSSLYRPKWDEKRGKATYGESTLYKAINDTNNVFTPTDKKELPKYDFQFLNTKEPEKTKEHPPRSWDDTGNAQRFLDRYGDVAKYTFLRKTFYVYDGTVWKEDNEGLVFKLVDLVIEDMKNEPIYVSDPTDEKLVEQMEKEWNKHLKSSRSNRSKKAMVEEIKHNVSVLPESFDQNDMLLNTENGYLDLSSGEVLGHDKAKLFSKKAKVEYSDKAAPDAWLDFLKDIFDHDEEMIDFIQKAVGYSLTGSSKEQVMFVLLGSGRNGKSLFINTLATILGDYSTNMQAETLMVKRGQGGSINNDVARLENARFVTSSEPNEGFIFDEGLVKQMTGDDKITARYLRQENFEFEAKFKIWLATNHRPIVRGTDDGIWRRFVTIPFEVQIPEHKVDRDLKYKLLREAPAILDWALEGCLLWQKEGLELPEKIKQSNQQYRSEMDITDAFIEDCCEVGEGFEIGGGELYEKYKQWANANGQYDVGSVEFGKRMKKKFTWKRSNGTKYIGIGLLKDGRMEFLNK